jgi:hypothetical protein
MVDILDINLETAKAALNPDIRRKIDNDLKFNKCIWCKSGGGKKRHQLINRPNARPAADSHTPLSNEVFNTGQEDTTIAYIHHLQLSQHPREDGATIFLTGLPRAQMATFVMPAATQATPARVPSTVAATHLSTSTTVSA